MEVMYGSPYLFFTYTFHLKLKQILCCNFMYKDLQWYNTKKVKGMTADVISIQECCRNKF